MTRYTTNTLVVDFKSILAMIDGPMVAMFKMLEFASLYKFLFCGTRLFEPVLDGFFTTKTVEHWIFLCTMG